MANMNAAAVMSQKSMIKDLENFTTLQLQINLIYLQGHRKLEIYGVVCNFLSIVFNYEVVL